MRSHIEMKSLPFCKEVRFIEPNHFGGLSIKARIGVILREHGGVIVSPETEGYASSYYTLNGELKYTEITKERFEQLRLADTVDGFIKMFDAD